MNIEKILKELSQPLEIAYNIYIEQSSELHENEKSIQSSSGNTGLHVREDDILELFAGSARILLNGTTGEVSIIGKKDEPK